MKNSYLLDPEKNLVTVITLYNFPQTVSSLS